VVAAKVKDLDADHYLWAAEVVAARLEGDSEVLEGGLATALKFSREHPREVTGILEVVIDVHTLFEKVRVSCYDTCGAGALEAQDGVECRR
jgi:anthranilate phosphoribosyltransferase